MDTAEHSHVEQLHLFSYMVERKLLVALPAVVPACLPACLGRRWCNSIMSVGGPGEGSRPYNRQDPF
jgi:hypothetical protein